MTQVISFFVIFFTFYQHHYANECDEDANDEDDDTVKKTSNKEGSNFMNHGQLKRLKWMTLGVILLMIKNTKELCQPIKTAI